MNSQPQEQHIAANDDEISLGDIWQALKARSLLIFSATFLSAAVAAAIAFSLTPIFRTEVVLAVVEEAPSAGGALAGQFGGLASLAGVSLGGSSSRSEAVGTLSSRKLLETYISTEKLLPELFYAKWDAQQGDWKADVEKKPTLWEATQKFSKSIRKITDDKKTSLVTLTVEWRDAELAARWANDLVRLANLTLRERAISKSEGNLAYLNQQLEKTSVVELRQAIFRLIESEVKNVMLAKGSEDYAFKVIDPGVVAEKKAKPKRALIVAVGAFLGLMLSSFYALAKGKPQA